MENGPVDHESGMPGEGLDYSRMPGHWLLAQMGKRALRPGGIGAHRSNAEGPGDRIFG